MIRRLSGAARSCLHALNRARHAAGSWLALLASLPRRPQQIVARWPEGEAALGPRVAILVHWDRRGRLGEPVRHYLTALRQAGLSIVLVSNAGKLTADAWDAARALCDTVIVRRNIGYDFGAMREGLEACSLPRADTDMVLIVNDSLYGPLAPLDETLARIDFTQADFWGATESWQRRYHLQSFFLAAGRTALDSPAWKRFWSGVRPIRSKSWVIRHYEVGLTGALLTGGLTCAAIWPYRGLAASLDIGLLEGEASRDPVVASRRIHTNRIRLAAAARRPLNPTADLWRQLLRARFPFIKRELLVKNPSGIEDVADWREVATETFGTDLGFIERDLQRALRDKTP